MTPIVVALASLFGQAWAPVFDMAIIEQHVRDVFTEHVPLLGPVGRFGSFDEPARHPGPLFYYLLAVPYRLLGGSAWALQAASATLHLGAIATALWLASRRGRAGAVVAVGAGIGWLMQGYGLTLLTNPWNPHLVVLWFVVFLVAVWSIWCGDWAVLPVAAAAASLCMQSHISYVPVCGGLGALTLVVVGLSLGRLPGGSSENRRGMRFLALASMVTALLWLPPLIEQGAGSPGNLTALVRYFREHADASLGVRQALPLMASRLDAWHLVVEQLAEPGGFENPLPSVAPEPWRGGLFLAVWLLCVLASLRLPSQPLRRAHAVVGAALVISLIAMSRVVGGAWNYIILWGWAVGASLIVAVVATVVAALVRRAATRPRLGAAVGWVGLGLIVVSASRLTSMAWDFEPRASAPNAQLAALVPRVVAALEAGQGGATGAEGRYVVTWSDGFYGGGQAIGLANELERAGYDAALEPHLRAVIGAHRSRPLSRATARIHLATAGFIRSWKKVRGATLIAQVDLRTPHQRREYAKLHRSVVEALREAGRRDLARSLRYRLPVVPSDVSPLVTIGLGRLAEIGVPAAVFIVRASD